MKGSEQRLAARPWRCAALAICMALAAASGAVAAGCPARLPVVRDITADRFYTDAASSVADPQIVARNKASLEALDQTLRPIIRASDLALRGDEASALCAVGLFAAQAKGGGMLGTMSSRQAEMERKWRTAGLSVAWLKVRHAASPASRAEVETWLLTLARQVEADYGLPREPNNHYYWAGLVAAAVGTATGDGDQLAYARQAYLSGLDQIAADGTLPRELRRKAKALSYHNYALAPLILSAELASARGEDWYSLRDGVIHRLAARTLAGLADPSAFAELAGEPSVEVPKGGILGWLAFYRARFPRRAMGGPEGPFRYDWLGGDLSQMAVLGIPR